MILVAQGCRWPFFASLTYSYVAEEAEMTYLADFYALYLARNSNVRSETLYRDSRRLVEPEYPKTQFGQIGMMLVWLARPSLSAQGRKARKGRDGLAYIANRPFPSAPPAFTIRDGLASQTSIMYAF